MNMHEREDILFKNVDALAPNVFPVCEFLTNHPEVGGEENLASSYVTKFLSDYGYEIELDYSDLHYAFRASRHTGKPRIAVMCEYDALPEIGHACGHSLSCAISILAALSVSGTFSDLPFDVDLIGTPGEETIGGKVQIAENGGFDDYLFAIMGHIDSVNAPQFKAVACNDMYITFKGTAAHASSNPWDGRSALNAAQLFMHGVDLNKIYYKPFMQMHGIIREGGVTPGTLPEKVVLEYYPRAASMVDLSELNKSTLILLEGISYATETEFSVEQRYPTFAELHYGFTANSVISNLFEELGETVEPMEYPIGSSDVGNVDLVIPAFQLQIKGTDVPVPWHTVEFEKLVHGERAMRTLRMGAKVIAGFICRMGFEKGLYDKVKKEWSEYRLKQ